VGATRGFLPVQSSLQLLGSPLLLDLDGPGLGIVADLLELEEVDGPLGGLVGDTVDTDNLGERLAVGLGEANLVSASTVEDHRRNPWSGSDSKGVLAGGPRHGRQENELGVERRVLDELEHGGETTVFAELDQGEGEPKELSRSEQNLEVLGRAKVVGDTLEEDGLRVTIAEGLGFQDLQCSGHTVVSRVHDTKPGTTRGSHTR
jgi:hypothetical protein